MASPDNILLIQQTKGLGFCYKPKVQKTIENWFSCEMGS